MALVDCNAFLSKYSSRTEPLKETAIWKLFTVPGHQALVNWDPLR